MVFPILTIEPNELGLTMLQTTDHIFVTLNISNLGKVDASNVSLHLPPVHPTLEFNSPVQSLGSVAKESSVTFPIKISKKGLNFKTNDKVGKLILI